MERLSSRRRPTLHSKRSSSIESPITTRSWSSSPPPVEIRKSRISISVHTSHENRIIFHTAEQRQNKQAIGLQQIWTNSWGCSRPRVVEAEPATDYVTRRQLKTEISSSDMGIARRRDVPGRGWIEKQQKRKPSCRDLLRPVNANPLITPNSSLFFSDLRGGFPIDFYSSQIIIQSGKPEN